MLTRVGSSFIYNFKVFCKNENKDSKKEKRKKQLVQGERGIRKKRKKKVSMTCKTLFSLGGEVIENAVDFLLHDAAFFAAAGSLAHHHYGSFFPGGRGRSSGIVKLARLLCLVQ